MSRHHMTEQARRMRHEDQRSPIDAAYFALCSLSSAGRDELQRRFNATFEKSNPPLSITFSEARK
jgi:hypothetical protein